MIELETTWITADGITITVRSFVKDANDPFPNIQGMIAFHQQMVDELVDEYGGPV